MAYVNPQRQQGVYSDKHKSRRDFPLLSSHYEYKVNGFLVLCTLTESYKTQAAASQQISYLFEIPPEASVVGLEAMVGNLKVKAIVEEKNQANKMYQQAVTTGVQGWKLDKLNGEVFSIGLGNAPPKSLITITVRYLHLISSDSLEDSVRLTVPVGLAPRPGVAPGGSMTTPTAAPEGNAVTITVGINAEHDGNNNKILNLHCLSHNASITSGFDNASFKTMTPVQQAQGEDRGKAYVEFWSKGFLHSHFVLVWSIPRIDAAQCVVQRLPSAKTGQTPTSAFALTLVSNVSLEPDEHEYIFLVDSSGSMSGSRTLTARNIVETMLHLLPKHNRSLFNVYSFNTKAWSVLPGGKSVGYDTRNISNVQLPKSASGGTNIQNALNTVLEQRNTSKPRCSIIVLTDGLDWGVHAAIQTIQKAATKAAADSKLLRVFVMGLGDEVSRNMCESLARAGSGATAYVNESQLLEKDHQDAKARNMIIAINRAPVRVRGIEWGMAAAPDAEGPASTGSFHSSRPTPDQHQLGPAAKGDNLGPPKAIQQAPSPGTMFWAVRSYWYAIIRGEHPNQPFKATIKYDVPGKTNSRHKVEVNVKRLDHGKDLHRLAARALIETLEDEAISTTDAEEKYWKEAEIVRLGKAYGLASSQTSFIATMNGVGTLSHIASNAPSDGSQGHLSPSGVRGANFELDFVSSRSPTGAQSVPSQSTNARVFNTAGNPWNAGYTRGFQEQSFGAALSSHVPVLNMFAVQTHVNARSAAVREADIEENIISKIATAQNDDGSFDNTLVEQTVFPDVGIPAIPAFLTILPGSNAVKNRIWLAICAIAFLQEQHGDQKSQWASVREKAEGFIRQSLSSIFGIESSAVESILTKCLDDAEGYFF